MKQTILFLLALLMIFALLPAAYAETTTTVLMYMCGTDCKVPASKICTKCAPAIIPTRSPWECRWAARRNGTTAT